MTAFYGKLPAKGDFITRNLPRDFIDRWDDWLQSGMHASREALGDACIPLCSQSSQRSMKSRGRFLVMKSPFAGSLP